MKTTSAIRQRRVYAGLLHFGGIARLGEDYLLHHAVALVSGRLNHHLKGQLNSPDDLVVVTSLTDHEGKPAASARNRLVLFVTDVARESAARSVRVRSGSGGRIAVSPDPIHLNVYFMLAGNFDPDNYGEALKVLSHSVQFFQSNPVFDHRNAPEMAEGLEQLSCEIHNLSHEVSSHLWGVHGGRYVPSIHFKMRMIAIDSGVMEREDFVVRASETLAEAGEPG